MSQPIGTDTPDIEIILIARGSPFSGRTAMRLMAAVFRLRLCFCFASTARSY